MTDAAQLRAIRELQDMKDSLELCAAFIRLGDKRQAADVVCCVVRMAANLHKDLSWTA